MVRLLRKSGEEVRSSDFGDVLENPRSAKDFAREVADSLRNGGDILTLDEARLLERVNDQELYCESCSAEVSIKDPRCPRCGSKTAISPFACEKCGAPIDDPFQEKACTRCGHGKAIANFVCANGHPISPAFSECPECASTTGRRRRNK